MKTTINKLLEKRDIKLEKSIYKVTDERIREFVITSGDFYEVQSTEKWGKNSWVQTLFDAKMEEKKKQPVYRILERHYREIVQEIQKIKETDEKGYDHIPEIRSLRQAKTGVMQSIKELTVWYEQETAEELKKEYELEARKLLIYKNTVSMGSFSDLQRQIKAFDKLQLPWILKQPLFFGNLQALKEAAEKKIPIGIVGGPCLFGTYEVEIQIYHKDGSVFHYDFSSGHNYDNDGKMEFADHIENYTEEIREIHFCNKKCGVTVQEYESLEVLFLFGRALQAKVAIPIPDISYQKYLTTTLQPLDEEKRREIETEFRVETRKIADMYLKVIEDLKKRYPEVEVIVLHERAEAICAVFHERREVYFNNSKLIRRMTKERKKTEAIFDYISMLALPFYLWETPVVLQVDNLDETDSFRKCRKVHKDAFALVSVLYPERLSRNKEDTNFNAPIADKEYYM